MLKIFKKKKIEIINKKEFETNLSKLNELLVANEFYAQARVIENLISLLIQNDQESFVKLLKTVDMWGGSGAVWEVGGFKRIQDENAFRIEIFRLTELMKESQIDNYRSNSVGNLFKKLIK